MFTGVRARTGISSDHKEAKSLVMKLAQNVGFDAYDNVPLFPLASVMIKIVTPFMRVRTYND